MVWQALENMKQLRRRLASLFQKEPDFQHFSSAAAAPKHDLLNQGDILLDLTCLGGPPYLRGSLAERPFSVAWLHMGV